MTNDSGLMKNINSKSKVTAIATCLMALTFSIFSAAIVLHAPPALAQEEAPSAQINAWANVLRANGEYQKLLSEAQLNYAQSELINAQTAGEWQRVRHLSLLVDRAQLELRRLARDEAQLRRKIEGIQDHSRRVQIILTGRVTTAQLQSLNWLTINAIDPAVSFSAMTAEVGSIPDDEFTGENISESFSGENVGQLIDYIKRARVKVRPWGLANQALAQAVVSMAKGADEKLLVIQTNLAALRDRVDPFTLPSDGTKSPPVRPH